MPLLPETWPVPHPLVVSSVSEMGGTAWSVELDVGKFDVIQSNHKVTVSRDDQMPIWDRWFGVFMVLKNATTGPNSAWEMLIPTAAGCHDNLNQYHFRVLEGAPAGERSGQTRVIPWEDGPWKSEYDAAWGGG